ncbi:hypothetical protein BKA62DRAFT_682861 [Auriculariales sp. MPI-PUGE-AT-0066]|nr:hypothetical protein BKA62DRAFT_682861 [Auriculariales sp. MPI-PUGE-AT-0066]
MAEDGASNLIDVSFQTLHGMLSGQIEGTSPEKIALALRLRKAKFTKCVAPFGPPSAASKAKVESGSVTLDDGVKITIDAADKPFVYAVSKRYMLDEVEALVLLRSFLYNQGVPVSSEPDALADAIAEFYFTERLSVVRCFIPLLSARENAQHPLQNVSESFLKDVITNPAAFIDTLLTEYARRAKQELTPEILRAASVATAWAKQLAREQLAMVEVVFWLLWDLVPSTSLTAVQIFKAAYDSDLGKKQLYSAMLLEDEGRQILNDLECMWTVVLIESLNLEQVLDDDADISLASATSPILMAAPQQLVVIQQLVFSATQTDARYGPIVLAWCTILYRVRTMLDSLDSVPDVYERFVHLTGALPGSDPPVPMYQHLLMWTLCAEVDVLGRLKDMLTNAPLFVTSVAWCTGSSLTDPNAIAFRAVVKGLLIEFIPNFSALVDVWVGLFGTGEQYWTGDWIRFPRRQPFDFRPLIRMLGAMARSQGGALYAFHFLNELPSFTHVVSLDDAQAFNSTYQADPDSDGWTNIVPLRLPGGSIVAPGSSARILSGDAVAGAPIVLKWDHVYSGWGLLRDVLADCAHMRANAAAGRKVVKMRSATGTIAVGDLGIDLGRDEEDGLVVDGLTLIHNIIKYERDLVPILMGTLESESEATHQPNIVQLTILMLEEALVRARPAHGAHSAAPAPDKLITACLELLTILLPLHPVRVWPYLKTTTQLFGHDQSSQLGATPALLAAERIAGLYPMTRALILLVRAMLDDTLPLFDADGQPGLQNLREMKERVLLRALRLLHSEIWLEHAGWRFRVLGDRFEIAHRVVGLYTDVLRGGGGRGQLNEAVVQMFLSNATNASIGPLISPIVSATALLNALYKARRFAEARELVVLVESLLRFARLVLSRKPDARTATLLEHTMYTDGAGTGQRVPVDALAGLVSTREFGASVPAEAVALLTALTGSVAMLARPLALARHLSDPVATAQSIVRIAKHPYDDPALRIAVWKFIAVAVATQPAFAGLFIAGTFSALPKPHLDGDKTLTTPTPTPAPAPVALEMLWEGNPELLAAALDFYEAVWQQALEHKAALEATRRDPSFAETLAEIALAERGATPSWETFKIATNESGVVVSDASADVTDHAHRLVAKSRALTILALDVNGKASETHSLRQLLDIFADEKKLRSCLMEAMTNAFDQARLDALFESLAVAFPGSRKFGDEYVYDIAVLNGTNEDQKLRAEEVVLRACAVNLNWSIADAEAGLTQAWRRAVKSVTHAVTTNSRILSTILTAAAELSADVATIHMERLELLLSMLELVWFSNETGPTNGDQDKGALSMLLTNIEALINSETFPPGEPLRQKALPQYHTPLLQVIYICVRKVRANGVSKFKMEHRLTFKSAFTASVAFVIDGLSDIFSLIGGGSEHASLSQDTALLVSIFEQSIHPDIELWLHFWLKKCEEASLLRTSLEIVVKSNLTGTSEETVFARHILALHLALANVSSAADRLATEGIVPAYCSNSLASQVAIGNVEATIDQSPAHWMWCTILGVVTAILGQTGSASGRIAEDAIGFVQRTLSWQVEQPEMELVVGFFYALACVHDDNFPRAVLRAFAQRALLLLQHLNYALTHEKHLESLLELPPGSTTNQALRNDLIRRFMAMTSNVVAALSIITTCDLVFLRRPTEWPINDNVFIVPNINKTHRAPASFGTLFEIVTCTLDILRVPEPGQSKDLAVRSLRTSETVLTFTSGQLAMWVLRKEVDAECVQGETLRELRSDLLELLVNAHKIIDKRSKESAAYISGLTCFVRSLGS